MDAGIPQICRGSRVKFPLSSLQLAREHSRYSYITLYVCAEPSPGLGSCWKMDLDRKLLALASHRLEKVEKVDLLWRFCQYFQYITILLVTKFVIPTAKYSSSVLSALSLISYPFIFSPFLYSPSFFSCYLQKFTRKFHFTITLLVFSLHTHSVCFFLSSVLLLFYLLDS